MRISNYNSITSTHGIIRNVAASFGNKLIIGKGYEILRPECRDMSMLEALASDGVPWRAEVGKTLLAGEQRITLAAEEKRALKKAGCKISTTLFEAQFTGQNCGHVCISNIGKRCFR